MKTEDKIAEFDKNRITPIELGGWNIPYEGLFEDDVRKWLITAFEEIRQETIEQTTKECLRKHYLGNEYVKDIKEGKTCYVCVECYELGSLECCDCKGHFYERGE